MIAGFRPLEKANEKLAEYWYTFLLLSSGIVVAWFKSITEYTSLHRLSGPRGREEEVVNAEKAKL